jgi:hypothetical protein
VRLPWRELLIMVGVGGSWREGWVIVEGLFLVVFVLIKT